MSKNSNTSNIPELLQPSSKNSFENEQMLYPEDVIQGIQGTEAKGQTSFRPVLFKEKLEDFDVKYFPHGKFGYQLEDNQGNPPFPELPKISEAKISRIKVPLKESTEHPSNLESSSELGSGFRFPSFKDFS